MAITFKNCQHFAAFSNAKLVGAAESFSPHIFKTGCGQIVDKYRQYRCFIAVSYSSSLVCFFGLWS